MRELLLKIMELSSSHLEQLRISVYNDYIVIELYKVASKKQLKINPEMLTNTDPVACEQLLIHELEKLYMP